MSYFDELANGGVTVTSSYMLGSRIMKKEKMCFEFVWESGPGYHGIGVGLPNNKYIRYRHDSSSSFFGSDGESSNKVSGQSFGESHGEPIMLCFDRSNTANLQFHAIKGSTTRTYTCNFISSDTNWRILAYNCGNTGSEDKLKLHLIKKEMKNTMPDGFFSMGKHI